MKKISTLLLALAGMLAQAAPVERIYVSTDREVYLAGDAVWCSLSCLDGNGRFSDESAVSYVELVSQDGTACTAKIGLLGGRGAGSFRIPATAPTGTYRLIAYTAVNKAEEGMPWLAGSRLLTIFNSTSRARVADGVEIVPEARYEALQPAPLAAEGALEISTRVRVPKGAPAVLNLHNGGENASISLSVFHEDDLLPADLPQTPGRFLQTRPTWSASLKRPVSVERDGEVITARLRGTILKGEEDLAFAMLSAAGSPTDLYIGQSEGDDRLRFLYPAPSPLPKLRLSPSQRSDLTARKAALRAEKAVRIDTLTTFMAHREDLLLSSIACKRYHLDDYTRFPSFREIVVEIIPELRVRTVRGIPSLLLTYSDALGQRTDVTDDILVMMDGVVLTDLNLLLDFDAMLIEDIDIYDEPFLCGKTPFFGLVNVITKKNYVTALHFPANVRVLDFQGVAYPVAYNGAVPKGEGQDLRQLLYWHPLLQVDAASDYRIEFTAPGYAGRFKVVAEGFTEDGLPVYQTFTFEVE